MECCESKQSFFQLCGMTWEITASLVISHCTDSSWQKVNECAQAIEGSCEVNAKPEEAWAVE